MLNNIFELAAAIGVGNCRPSQSRALALIAKAVFKGSTYGVSVQQAKGLHYRLQGGKEVLIPDNEIQMHPEIIHAISISGIVEGTDIEIPGYVLQWPFSDKEFWKAVQYVDEACADAEAEWDAQGDE